MKKLLISLLLTLCLITPAFAQGVGIIWHTGETHTITWNPITNFSDGTAIPPELSVEFNIYIARHNDFLKEKAVFMGRVSTVGTIATIPVGKYYIGVEAVLMDAGEEVAKSSLISWTDDPLDVEGGVIFGVRFYKNPNHPGNIKWLE